MALLLLGAARAHAQVSYQRLLGAEHEPQNWLTYSGRYTGWRYSTLDQINTGNASQLRMQWAFQVADLGQFETTPLVVDGVLYGTGQNDRAFALDARTGRPIWRYERNLPDKLQPCCGMVNRGFAILGNKLFMATLDAHVIALDTKTGNLVWDAKAADSKAAYTFTVAPLVVKNEVIVGISGGEYGGQTVFSGHGAGGHPTAVAVISDVLAIAHGSCPVNISSTRARVDGDFVVPHYIRFVVDDSPGIVAAIAGDLAAQGININALLQKPGYPKNRLPFVVTVEPCPSSALKAALKKIAQLDCMQSPPFDLQMLEE